MTEQGIYNERLYTYMERLGMMCGDGEPTLEQDSTARRIADEHVAELLRQEKQKQKGNQ